MSPCAPLFLAILSILKPVWCLGNNATIARKLRITEPQPFGVYHGRPIGYKGTLSQSLDVNTIANILDLGPETGLHILDFGKKEISTIGIVSGGAPNTVQEAIDLQLDAFLTGEPSHAMYSLCQEAGITMICGGHYATEVFGVQQMAQDLALNLDLETTFIALPTAL